MSLRRNGNLRDMRKRRVGVTARSREIVGQQATGALQIDAEIAAPLVLRTPKGTVAEATTECGWKRGDTGAKDNRTESSSEAMVENRGENGECAGGGAPQARMRRCLILRQGASPLRSPAPFPSALIVRKQGPLSRVRYAGKNRPPLTEGLASEHNIPVMRERGPTDRAHIKPPVGRQRSLSRPAAARALRAHEALPHAPPGGQAPLRPPIRGAYLTETGLLMEAATVRERSLGTVSPKAAKRPCIVRFLRRRV